jgi:Heterokaryon incompatibility protein (HET)
MYGTPLSPGRCPSLLCSVIYLGVCHSSHQIILNGKHLNVRENIYLFLHRLRQKGEGRHLWVDSICINQGDGQEKSEQVRMMGKIYESAKWVFVWLGDAANDSDLVMDVANFNDSYSIEEVRDITQRCLLPDVNVNFI